MTVLKPPERPVIVRFGYAEAREVKLILQFLSWQGWSHKFELDPGWLRHTKGQYKPVIRVNDDEWIVGFQALIRYWTDGGFWLC